VLDQAAAAQAQPQEIAANETVKDDYLGNAEMTISHDKPKGLQNLITAEHSPHGVSMEVAEGKDHRAVGARNGAGKDHELRSLFPPLMGLKRRAKARFQYIRRGHHGLAEPSASPGRRRLCLPEGGASFANLSGEENLKVDRWSDGGTWKVERIPAVPAPSRAQENRGRQLSGGERRCVDRKRAVLNPRLSDLDEPSQGVAPQCARGVRNRAQMKPRGISVLLVDRMHG